MAGIDTRILLTDQNGTGRYLKLQTFADRLEITDEPTGQMMTIALTVSVAGTNSGDQSAATVPLEPTWGLDAATVGEATLELSGAIAATSGANFLVRTADPMLPNATALATLPTGFLRNTTGTGMPSIAAPEDFPSDASKCPLAGPGSGQAFTVGSFGCNGKTPQGTYAVNAAATDLATAIALVNQLRAALIANGIAV